MQYLILPINNFKPTAGYKNSKYKSEWGYTHYGVDCVSSTKKTELYGMGEGTVVASGLDGLNGKTTGTGSGCGYVLVVVYKDVYNHKLNALQDVTVTYMHMDANPKVKAGDKVTTATLLGHYGNTGANTTGAHLHIQVDTDTDNPLYCCGLSAKGHNILKKGTADSTINPIDVFHVGNNQTVKTVNSAWYNSTKFNNIPKIPEIVNAKEYEVVVPLNIYSSSADAKANSNASKNKLQPGIYYIYNKYPNGVNGMYNISTDKTGNSVGSWINPDENKNIEKVDEHETNIKEPSVENTDKSDTSTSTTSNIDTDKINTLISLLEKLLEFLSKIFKNKL